MVVQIFAKLDSSSPSTPTNTTGQVPNLVSKSEVKPLVTLICSSSQVLDSLLLGQRIPLARSVFISLDIIQFGQSVQCQVRHTDRK